MSLIRKQIPLKRKNDHALLLMDIEYDNVSYEIRDLNGILNGRKFSGGNLYKSFLLMNSELNGSGYKALCNGARKDVSLSGGVADVAGGAMIYVDDREKGFPVVYIFDSAVEEDIE